jgi:hypothetical protein
LRCLTEVINGKFEVDAVNFCDKCGNKLIGSVCENCTNSVVEPPISEKSKSRKGIVIGILIAALTIVGFIWISNSSSVGGKLFDSARNAFDTCKGEAGCVVAKESLKNGEIVIAEEDIYKDLVKSCERLAPEGLVDDDNAPDDEIYARTNWLVPCINHLYREYSSRYGKTIEFE